MPDYVTLQGDALELMRALPDDSVDMVLTDPPYTQLMRLSWDRHGALDYSALMQELRRVTRPRGAVVFFASMQLAVKLITAAPDIYRYDLVWEKPTASNVPNMARQPGRVHEHILVFSRSGAASRVKEPMWYYPVLAEGPRYTKNPKTHCYSGWSSGIGTLPVVNEGTRQPRSVIFCKLDLKPRWHPTQKPVPLLEWLIKTYTQPGQLVLDPFMGSGSTLVAALNLGRLCVGMEKDPEIFATACERLLQNA